MALESVAALSTIFAVAGGTAAVAGTGYQMYENNMANKASQKAEDARKRQLELDTAMKQRAIMRSAQLARATAVSRQQGQTGGVDDSAGFGAFGQIQGQQGEQSFYQSQNADIGRTIFDANQQLSEANAGQAIGKSFAGFGMDLIKSGPTLGSIGADLFGNKANSVNYDPTWSNTRIT